MNRLPLELRPGMVIGTIHSAPSLKAAGLLSSLDADLLELRVDAFAEGGEKALATLRRKALKLPLPLVVTVRDAREGGAATAIPIAERQRLHRGFLEAAALIDVELRNAHRSRVLIREAKEAGRGVILSCHDFKRTPSVAALLDLAAKAIDSGATVFKLAATANTPLEFSTLLQFLTEAQTSPSLGVIRYSVMGMGDYGKVSRLALGRAGSVLNYGFLHKAQVPGQWPAQELKRLLAECGAQS